MIDQQTINDWAKKILFPNGVPSVQKCREIARDFSWGSLRTTQGCYWFIPSGVSPENAEFYADINGDVDRLQSGRDSEAGEYIIIPINVEF